MGKTITNEGENIITFDIYDLGLGAALLSSGHELIAMHLMEDCPCPVFHFVSTKLVKQDAEAYCNGNLSVNAKQYCYAYECIDDYLYGELTHED